MRRWLVACLLLLLVLPSIGHAQDQELAWELSIDNYLDIEDLGFRFYYPMGWVYAAGNGINFAETEADLEAVTDDDDSTQPSGVTFTITGIPVEALQQEFGEGLGIDEYLTPLLEVAGITEQDRAEFPVMTRRAITVFGENASGRPGIGTAWMQPDYLVIASISAPTQDELNEVAYTWGFMLSSVVPLNMLELGDEVITAHTAGFSIAYPDGWFLDTESGFLVYEIEDDITSENAAEGLLLGLIDESLEDVGLDEDATVEDLAASNVESLGLNEPTETSEMVILEQSALMIKAEDGSGNGQWGLVTQVIIDGRAITMLVIAPSEEALDEFEPTWINILQNIVPPQ